MVTTRYYMEDVAPKSVKYTGSDALKRGYLVCYDRDNASSYAPTATAYAAANRNPNRFHCVEKPAAGNLYNVAGVVARDYPAVSGGREIEIIPLRPGIVLDLFTSLNCTLGSTLLCVKANSYIASAIGTGPVVGMALQTVDRSGTNGLVQSVCTQPDILRAPHGLVAGRQPSKLVWESCPWAEIKSGLVNGIAYRQDFHGNFAQATNLAARAAGGIVEDGWVAFTGNDAGNTITMPATDPNGVTLLQLTGDNLTTCLAWGGVAAAGQMLFASGKPAWYEARVKFSNVDDDTGGWFIGLGEEGLCVTLGILGNDDAPTSKDLIGFLRLVGDGNAIQSYHRKAGGAGVVVDAAVAALVADTWINLGIYSDGTTIYFFADGAQHADTALLATATVPTGEELCLYFAGTNKGTTANSLSVDWVQAARII